MEKEHSFDEWQEKKNEKDREILRAVAVELLNSGLSVNWSGETSGGVGILVDGKCLIRPHLGDKLLGKFWYSEDQKIKAKVKSALGDRIVFAEYEFDFGGPNVGG